MPYYTLPHGSNSHTLNSLRVTRSNSASSIPWRLATTSTFSARRGFTTSRNLNFAPHIHLAAHQNPALMVNLPIIWAYSRVRGGAERRRQFRAGDWEAVALCAAYREEHVPRFARFLEAGGRLGEFVEFVMKSILVPQGRGLAGQGQKFVPIIESFEEGDTCYFDC